MNLNFRENCDGMDAQWSFTFTIENTIPLTLCIHFNWFLVLFRASTFAHSHKYISSNTLLSGRRREYEIYVNFWWGSMSKIVIMSINEILEIIRQPPFDALSHSWSPSNTQLAGGLLLCVCVWKGNDNRQPIWDEGVRLKERRSLSSKSENVLWRSICCC